MPRSANDDPLGRNRGPEFSDEDDDEDNSFEHHDGASEDGSEDSEQDAEAPDLSPEKTEQLLQLQAITGIDDLEVNRALLESNGWNLEATVREHLGEAPASEQRRRSVDPSRPPPDLPMAPNAHHHRLARPDDRSLFWRLFSWGSYLFTLPVRLPYRVLSSVLTSLYGVGVAVLGFPPLQGGKCAGGGITCEYGGCS